MALALIKEFSLSRDGLMTINFKSNVRNLEQDVKRKQLCGSMRGEAEAPEGSTSFKGQMGTGKGASFY